MRHGVHRFVLTGLFAALLASGVACSRDAHAQAASAAVVLSHDSAPYREATQGIRDMLSASGIDLRVTVVDAAGRLPPGAVPPGVPVVALGQRAGTALDAMGRGDPVTCMVLDTGGRAGVSLTHAAGPRFERIRALLPDARTVGILVTEGSSAAEIADIRLAARRVGLAVVEQRIDLQRHLSTQLEPLADRIDVLVGTYDLKIYSQANSHSLMLFSYQNRIPVVGISDAWTRAGALMSFDWDYRDLGRQCGAILKRVPADAGATRPNAEAPRRVTFSLSLSAALYFRVKISPELLRDARQKFD